MKQIKHTLTILLALVMVFGTMAAAAAAEEDASGEEGYEEWQTESDGYTEETVTVEFILEGADAVDIRIADSETWESVSDGDSVDAVRSDSIEIRGIEGCWLSAAYAETREEAKNSPAATLSESEGGDTSVGIDNDGYVYVRAAALQDEAAGNAASGSEDQDGNVSWDEVSNSQADAGAGKSTSTYKKGQKFYGKATAVSRVLRNGGSTITFRHDNGWLKNETKVKNITAVCISGHSRGLAYVGAVFNYVATVKEVKSGKLKVQVVYYPRKNKPNTWYGGVMASKAQIMAKTLWVSQYVHTGHVKLMKKAGPSEVDYLSECPVNYSLGGAAYYLYTDSACTERAVDTDGNQIVLTTDGSGASNTAEVDLEGSSRTFWAKEITASSGYKYDTAALAVTVSAENTESDPAVINSSEPPAAGRPEFRVYKLDPSGRYSWNKLSGAEYTISYYDVKSRDAISGASPVRSWTFKTRKMQGESAKEGYYAGFDWDADEALEGSDGFYIETGKRIIPCGWFTIRETRAPSGLALDSSVTYGRVYQPANGSSAEVSIESAQTGSGGMEVVMTDMPQAVRLIINKTDASTGENTAREAETSHSASRLARYSSLAGAVYEVYYDDNDLSGPELVGRIVTDENGHGELSERQLGDERMIGDRLAVGDYLIREIKAPPGFVTDNYVLSGNTQKERGKESIEVICGYDADGKAVTKKIGGSYSEGYHIFRTRAESEDTEVFTYTVGSADEPVRLHVSKTDITTGKELPGARLQIISANEEDTGTVVEEWTSTADEHLVWELPAGKYILREITAPYGYDVAEDVTFEIREGVIENRAEMKNRPLHIATVATDSDSRTHHGTLSGSETIIDRVNISGLYAERTYEVSGCLVDRASGEVLKDADGNEIRASKEFTAAGSTVCIELEFTVDSSAFDQDMSLVAFEKIYRTGPAHGDGEDGSEEADLPLELAKHEDIGNESQSVHYGGIAATTAIDKRSKSKDMSPGRSAVIRDYVEYKNLSPEETYTLEAVIYDRTEGGLTDISAVMDFTPAAADGTAVMDIGLDARGMEGHELVVFEKLYLNGRLIDSHEDPESMAQTVFIAERNGPVTADADRIALYVLPAVMFLAAALMICIRRIRELR